jgi:hypothetical protein
VGTLIIAASLVLIALSVWMLRNEER